jgi:hypothetical protein
MTPESEIAAHVLAYSTSLSRLNADPRLLLGAGAALGAALWALRPTTPSVRPSPGRGPSPSGGAPSPAPDAAGAGGRTNGGLRLRPRDAGEVATAVYTTSASYWRGIVARRRFVMLHGKPKEGKTTLGAELVGALVRGEGEEFLGAPTLPGGTSVVYVSEELGEVFAGKARRMLGPLARPAARLVWWWERLPLVRWVQARRGRRRVWHIPLPEVGAHPTLDTLPLLIREVERFAHSVRADVLVWDTLKAICASAITSVDAAESFVDEMKSSCARGFCNIVIHHDKENGTMQGPQCLYGGVDFDLHQSRIKGAPADDPRRQVILTGRGDGVDGERVVYRMGEDGRLYTEGAPSRRAGAGAPLAQRGERPTGSRGVPGSTPGGGSAPAPLPLPVMPVYAEGGTVESTVRPGEPNTVPKTGNPAPSLTPLPLPVMEAPSKAAAHVLQERALRALLHLAGGGWVPAGKLAKALVDGGVCQRTAAYKLLTALAEAGRLERQGDPALPARAYRLPPQ